MKNKIVKAYTYVGLGFPIELHNVEFVYINDEYHPKINVRAVAKLAIKSLVIQKNRLTGNQIKFIRDYFSMSLRDFAKFVNESHMAVKKWEDFKDKETNMDKNIEIMLRLHIYDKVVIKNTDNSRAKIAFYNQFTLLTKIFGFQIHSM